MRKEVVCGLCSERCWLLVEVKDSLEVEGNRCGQGEEFVRRWLGRERVSLSALVDVEGGEWPVVPVCTEGLVERDLVGGILEELSRVTLKAPVRRGEVVLENVLGLGIDLVATRDNFRRYGGVNERFLSLLGGVMRPRFRTGICAHRGDKLYAPENTLAAFSKCLELEVEMVELDIHLTRDRRIVVIHDADVNRTTDGSGRVRELGVEEIRALDAGSWFGEEFSGERVPLLEEVLELLGGSCVLLIEIKYPTTYNRGIEEELLHLLREFDMEDRVILSVRSLEYAKYLRTLSRLWWIVYLSFTRGQMRSALEAPIDGISPMWRLLTEEITESFKRRGKLVLPWTVNERRDMEVLASWGVDAIITDRIWDCLEVLLGGYRLEGSRYSFGR